MNEIQSVGDDERNESQRSTKSNDQTQHPEYHGNQTLIVWSTLPVATTLTNLGAESAVVAAVEPLAFASVVTARRPHANVVTKCP